MRAHTPLEQEYIATVGQYMAAGEPGRTEGDQLETRRPLRPHAVLPPGAGVPLFERPSSIMLFTYTDRDGYVPPSELSRELLTGGSGGGHAAAAPTAAAAGDGLPSSAVERAGAASRPAGISDLAAHLLNPAGSDPRGPLARAGRERPYATMYVMAAVGVAKEDFRARRLDTRLWEVPIAVVRYYGADTPTGGGGGGGSGGGVVAQLLELRPGFSDPLPLDASILRVAAGAGVTGDTFLGPGKFGGTLRLRQLLPAAAPLGSGDAGAASGPTPAYGGDRRGSAFGGGDGAHFAGRWGSAAAAAAAHASGSGGLPPVTPRRDGGPADGPGSLWSPSAPLHPHQPLGGAGGAAPPAATAIPAIVEVHSFSTPAPDHATYEFFLLNPAEDVVPSLLAGPLAVPGTGDAARSRAAPLLVSDSDPIARLIADERGAVAAAAHRTGGLYAWRGSLPPPGDSATLPAPGSAPHASPPHHAAASFVLHLNVELVAAAAFPGREAGDGVFVAWEIVLPVGQGWSVLGGGAGSSGAAATDAGPGGEGRWVAMTSEAVVDAEDPWVMPRGRGDDGGDSSSGSESGGSSGPDGDSKADDGAEALLLRRPRAASGGGLRRRRGGAPRAKDGLKAASAAAAGASAAPAPRARALVVPALSGVTQVARFAERPWAFGRAAPARGVGLGGSAVMGMPSSAATALFPGTRASARASAHSTVGPGHKFSGAAASRSVSTLGGLVDAAGLGDAAEKAEAGATDDCGGGAEGLRAVGGDFAAVREVEGGGERGGVRESLCTRLCCIVPRGAPFEPRVPVAHLCCPLPPLAFLFDARAAAAAGRAIGADAPQLYLAVFSRDSWGRTRAEGYGYADLPTAASSTDVLVRTWLPVEGAAAQERSFFLGGGGRLVDATAAGVPAGLVAAGRLRAPPPSPMGPADQHQRPSQPAPEASPPSGGAEPPAYSAGASVADSVRAAAQSVGVSRYGWSTRGSGEVGVRVHAMRENAPAVVPSAGSAAQAAAASARTRSVNEIIAEARALRDRDRRNASAAAFAIARGGEGVGGDYY